MSASGLDDARAKPVAPGELTGQPDELLVRLSLNQSTTENWSVPEAVDGCLRAGIPSIGLWRHKVVEAGLAASAHMVRKAGLNVSSLCRGGMFPAPTASERQSRIDDNRRAIEEAASLGTALLVLVCGAHPECDLESARLMVAEGIAAIAPYAAEHGIRLGIEPLHPMFAADRSVIVTLAQALDIAENFNHGQVGVIVDVYHVWWDPELFRQLARAAGRILSFHVSDWIVPTPDLLLGRGMMGDGVIDIRRIRMAVDATGYCGPIEVEIFNRAIWDAPGDEVLARIKQRFLECV